MAHGVSSSVELVQSSHAVTKVQLRFGAFCEYVWNGCAHRTDQSVSLMHSLQSTDGIIAFFSAFVMSSNVAVSQPICDLNILNCLQSATLMFDVYFCSSCLIYWPHMCGF